MTNSANLTAAELEAVRTLKSLIEISAEELEDKRKAGTALIQALADLHDVVGFVVKTQPFYTALLFSQTKQAILRLSKEQDIVLSNADRNAIPLAIEYDRNAKVWIGTEIDPSVVPMPGQHYPRKQPLVALAEGVVRAIDSNPVLTPWGTVPPAGVAPAGSTSPPRGTAPPGGSVPPA